ncbi:MAG: tRNA (N6-isopentenyl adenosine(37)-C2)-methylthiotransferase MiaB, partial [bacterium (Candidatus Ratteibacteria) CG23_combo_of_CG06-09_8_20_14_all_48_7]
SFPYLDFLAGPESLAEVPSLIEICRTSPVSGKKKAYSFTATQKPYFCPQNGETLSAFLPVITGCNNFCSYCVVPYARGAEE